VTTQYNLLLHTLRRPQSRLHYRCLVAASNSDLALRLGFLTVQGLSLEHLIATAHDDSIPTEENSKSKFYRNQRSVVCLGGTPPPQIWATRPIFLLLSVTAFLMCGEPLWRDDVSVV
jgi:hypothetical protein